MYTEDDTFVSEESSLNSSLETDQAYISQKNNMNPKVAPSRNVQLDSPTSSTENSPTPNINDSKKILGSDLSGSSSSDSENDSMSISTKRQVADDRNSGPHSDIDPEPEEEEKDNDDDEDDNEDGDGDEELEETRIAVDFPFIRADLGREVHLLKMPNFLSVETRPFDPEYYENEQDNSEILDEEGRTRLKLKVENTIRWRHNKTENVHMNSTSNKTSIIMNEDKHSQIESNARIVKWSDGSMSLHLGDEIFDVHSVDIQSDYNHLFIREGSGLQAQAIFKDKLTFRPHSTDSFTHRKITKSLIDKTNRTQKVKILPVAGADPETNRLKMIKKEEEHLRASLRRESQQRRMREKQLASAASRGRYNYDENFIDDGNTFSITDVKNAAKTRKNVSSVYSSDSESLSGISEVAVRSKKSRVINDESD